MKELPPPSPFAGDDGSADARLSSALQTGSVARVVAALAGVRVLVPVLAQLEVSEVRAAGGSELQGELVVDKEASAGIVALQVADGRSALPVFSSVATMTRWHAAARPVPTAAPRAARSALGEGWEVLVLDPGGPTTVVIPRPAVVALARGLSWEPAVTNGVVDAAVRTAVANALADVPAVVGVDAEPGRRAEVAVVLALAPGLDRGALDAVVSRVNAALAANETVAERVDSLELRLVSAAGAATPTRG